MEETFSAEDFGNYHQPVLWKEALDALAIRPDDTGCTSAMTASTA